jgi:hypothetical protein
VVIGWNGRNPADYWPISVSATTSGYPPFARNIGPGTYELNVLTDATYQLSAELSCRAVRRQASTETITVAGAEGADTITLTFPPGGC